MIFTAYEISKEPIEEDDYLTKDYCIDYLDKYDFDYCKDADCDDRLSDIGEATTLNANTVDVKKA